MAHEWAKGTLAALLLFGMLYAFLKVESFQRDTPAQERVDGIAEGLFGPWLFAFEILSLLLLVALVGALYISAKRPEEESP